MGGYDVVQKSKVKCFFCHKDGHKKSECRRFTAWLEKQRKQEGKPFAFVCSESNMIDVPSNSWWLDSGATVHVAVTL